MSQSMQTEGPSNSVGKLKSYSCLVCRQRKVKCDRQSPCNNCLKAGSQCSFVPPVRGKRKRTKPVHEGMHAKLKRYEDLLKKYGADIDPNSEDEGADMDTTPTSAATNQSPHRVDDVSQPATASTPVDKPKLVTKDGSSRYFENSFWSSVSDEFHHPDEYSAAEDDDDTNGQEDELLFGSLDRDSSLFGQSPQTRLGEYYPPLHVLQKLKDVFLDRIDPLLKILHMPTFWADTTKAVQQSEKVPKSLEAAIFCFYLSAISVLDDEQCKNILGEAQAIAFARCRKLARQALINAGFLHTASPMTLRAFLLFQTSLRGQLRHDTQFVLSGVALRLAMKMGLHRDGEALGLPPFETEMRRRLWWHTAHMDFRAADMLGSQASRDVSASDAKTPLNVEDEDLYPGMAEFPQERRGITSISSCSVRCEILHFLERLQPSSSPCSASWESLASDSIPMAKKDAMIDEIEDFFERKYLRYCDPMDPLHTISAIMMRSSVYKMRLHAHNPKSFVRRQETVTQAERNIVLTNAMKIIQYASSANHNPALQKYQWRVGTSYLWDMLLYVLIEAKRLGTGAEVDRLWSLLGTVLPADSDIYKEKPAVVNAALRKWTLEAWESYVAATKAAGQLEPETPEYIDKMLIAVASAKLASGRAGAAGAGASSATNVQEDSSEQAQYGMMQQGANEFDGYNIPDLTSFDMDFNEWLNWEQILSGASAMGKKS